MAAVRFSSSTLGWRYPPEVVEAMILTSTKSTLFKSTRFKPTLFCQSESAPPLPKR